jgi:hypothetical protein
MKEPKSQRMTSQLVAILRSKGHDHVHGRTVWMEMAGRISRCRTPYTDAFTKKEKNLPWCKHALCPNCQTRIAKMNYRVLFSQFEEFIGSDRLYEIRITYRVGNVSGSRLRRVIRRMVAAFRELTSRSAWNAVVVRAGAVIHPTWKEASDNHGAGYHVHLHAIVLTTTSLPRFDAVRAECQEVLGVDANAFATGDDYFSHRPVRNLSRTARYLTHWRKRVCGAPPIGGRFWSLWKIPDVDIVAYVDATKNHLRIFQRGLDPDVLRVARRRIGRSSEKAGPRQMEMASVYTQLSFRSPKRLTSRFSDLAEFVEKRCQPSRPCHLRAACPWCLRHRLGREVRRITKGFGVGEDLAPILLRAPGLVAHDQLESTAAAFQAAVKKLLRPGQLGTPACAWKIHIRPVSVDGCTMFRISARLLVGTSFFNSTKLKSCWQRQLKSVGLKCRPEGKKAVMAIHPASDLDSIAPKLVGRAESLLGPVETMKPVEASAYLHAVAMRTGLVISENVTEAKQAHGLPEE